MTLWGLLWHPRTRLALYWAIVAVAAILRLWKLDQIPLGFWYDEAFYSLNALSIGHGHWPIFFVLEEHPAEPLFIYSLAAFFAISAPTVLAARVHSALWGTATVALLYPFARRAVGERWGLVACLIGAVMRWPLHFSRTVFRAMLAPFFVLLVVIFFLRWRKERQLRDAIACGAAMGLGLYTYLSLRLLPLFWLGWVAWLVWRGEICWRRDCRGLATVIVTCLVVFSPLAVDYLRNPGHFTGRLEEVSMFRKVVESPQSDGTVLRRKALKPFGEIARNLAANAWAIARMWTVRGDHVARHNLPHEPVFDWVSGIIFYLGLAWCVAHAGRSEFAFLLPWWLVVFSLASVFSFGAPNILRMQAMIPAVVATYVVGLRLVHEATAPWLRRPLRCFLGAALVALFAFLQLDSYFRRFANSPAMRREFLYDTFYVPARVAAEVARGVREVWVPDELATHLTFRFVTHDVKNLRAYASPADLPTSLTRPCAVLTTMHSVARGRDQGHDVYRTLRELHAEHQASFTVPVESPDGPSEIPWANLWLISGEAPRDR